MAQYHVGCGTFDIYAGTLMPKGDKWRNKSRVTEEACDAVAQYLLQNDKRMYFTYYGKRYTLCVCEGEVRKEEVEHVGMDKG